MKIFASIVCLLAISSIVQSYPYGINEDYYSQDQSESAYHSEDEQVQQVGHESSSYHQNLNMDSSFSGGYGQYDQGNHMDECSNPRAGGWSVGSIQGDTWSHFQQLLSATNRAITGNDVLVWTASQTVSGVNHAYIVQLTDGTYHGFRFYSPITGAIQLTSESTNHDIEQVAQSLGVGTSYRCHPYTGRGPAPTPYPTPTPIPAPIDECRPRSGGWSAKFVDSSIQSDYINLRRQVVGSVPRGEGNVVWAASQTVRGYNKVFIIQHLTGQFSGYRFSQPLEGPASLTSESKSKGSIEQVASDLGVAQALRCSPYTPTPTPAPTPIPAPAGNCKPRNGGWSYRAVSSNTQSDYANLRTQVLGNVPKGEGSVVWAASQTVRGYNKVFIIQHLTGQFSGYRFSQPLEGRASLTSESKSKRTIEEVASDLGVTDTLRCNPYTPASTPISNNKCEGRRITGAYVIRQVDGEIVQKFNTLLRSAKQQATSDNLIWAASQVVSGTNWVFITHDLRGNFIGYKFYEPIRQTAQLTTKTKKSRNVTDVANSLGVKDLYECNPAKYRVKLTALAQIGFKTADLEI